MSSCCPVGRGGLATTVPAVATTGSTGAYDGRMAAAAVESFHMGAVGSATYDGDGEGPIHVVDLSPFRIAVHAVTNDDFATFVDATGHMTDAERFGWSFVFARLLPDDFEPTRAAAATPWWRQVFGADWRRPEGPQSDLGGRSRHPVVHVRGTTRWRTALGAGRTCRRRRSGNARRAVACGARRFRGARPRAWRSTHDERVRGNVPDRRPFPADGSTCVMRGGSYRCHASYCRRSRVSASSANEPNSSSGNIGFRVAADG